MRFMWLGSFGLLVTFLCLFAGRSYGSFSAFVIAGALVGFALDIYSAVAIGRGQFKRARELPPRFDLWDERRRKAAARVRRTTTAGVVLVFLGIMVNFVRSLLGVHWPDPFWGLLLLFGGMSVQLFGLARYLERLQ